MGKHGKKFDKELYELKEYSHLSLFKIMNLSGITEKTRIFKTNHFVVLFSIENTGKYHISISHKHRYPTWDEIKWVKYEFFKELSEINMAMYFPKPENFINVHENCFHLYEI